jgi:hypothetical protein
MLAPEDFVPMFQQTPLNCEVLVTRQFSNVPTKLDFLVVGGDGAEVDTGRNQW